MRVFVGYVMAALVLAAGGEAFRRASEMQARLAGAQEQLATLAPDAAEKEFGGVESALGFAARTPIIGPALVSDVQEQRAAAAYWRGDYGLLPTDEAELAAEGTDPDIVFLSANAGFRNALAQKTPQAALKDMDGVIRTYALLLKKEPNHIDAAYNYEYAVRLRNLLAKLRGGAQNSALLAQQNSTTKPDIHGDEGSPPPSTSQQDFQVIVPLRPEERSDQLKAGSGAGRSRKG